MLALFTITVGACEKQSDSKPSETAERVIPNVTIGIQVSPAMTLVMVAKEKGLFLKEGVNVELKEFTAGKFALQAFLSGAIDFAVSGEVPVALATLQGNPIRVVTQVVEKTHNEVRVVARREKNVSQPEQYFKKKKRKLATSFGGGPEFFTYSFLKRYEIEPNQIEILSQKPEDMPAALATGSVDAIAIFDPFAFIAEIRMGDKGVSFADPTLYSEFYVLNARPDQITQSPQVIEAIIRALDKAGQAIDKDPESAKAILQKYTKLDRPVIDGIWNNFVFRPALTQTLLEYWKAQAAWARDTGKVTPETEVPDFRTVVEPKFLKKVNHKAVKLQ
ncbi:MAG: NrtA/SsuA/CpmA family ABC transporter substrate-binding protein [Nitrososphaera sp.]|nr:NrtA/SsuA/CpmA family ABC transporter substrate-binding protein [Nitrososphaera sp.]